MKQTFCVLLLILGSVSYKPPPRISLKLVSGEVVEQAWLLELQGDSLRIEGDRWIALSAIDLLRVFQRPEIIEVTLKDGREFELDSLEVLPDGSLRGIGVELAGRSEIPFNGIIGYDDISGFEGFVDCGLWRGALIGAFFGCEIGCLAAGTSGTSFGLPNPGENFESYVMGGAVIGGVLGGVAAERDFFGEVQRFDFTRLSMHQKLQVVQMTMRQ